MQRTIQKESSSIKNPSSQPAAKAAALGTGGEAAAEPSAEVVAPRGRRMMDLQLFGIGATKKKRQEQIKFGIKYSERNVKQKK